MTCQQQLFEPIRINQLTLPNRFVMAPMSRHFSENGLPSSGYIDYFRRRAEGEVGLIITDCVAVPHPAALRDGSYPRFHGDNALAIWRSVKKAVHGAGGRIAAQLWHAGLTRLPSATPNSDASPAGPSGMFLPLDGSGGEPVQLTEPLSTEEIGRIIAAFGQAAASARAIGFDAIEIHAAHGYLIDQFFWATTNRRSDDWGGDLARRGRFAAEIVRECRRRTGPDFPILLRFSQWKQQDYAATLVDSPHQLQRFLEPLADAGVDAFHCSLRRFWEPAFEGDSRTLSGWTRAITGKPTITVGAVGLAQAIGSDERPVAANVASGRVVPCETDLTPLLNLFERGEFDMVAVGRALIANPDWVRLVRSGKMGSIRPYSLGDLGHLI
jgi:2,4-dienoyl-CoA reductase-like NADH-dependent reductase (Old Yellow Enzyme family)